MRIYRGRIEPTSDEIVKKLIKEEMVEIEPDQVDEVKKDIESVLNEYLRMEREINDKAKDIVARQDTGYSAIGRIKRGLAKEKNFGMEDDALDYIVQQMIEIMFSSAHVEEVFGEDHDINRIIAPILRKHMAVDEELEKEVKKQLKHLADAEGTQSYENEYSRVRANLERLKKLN